ncbi:MAG TPA: hypothetical protein VGL33_23720 [Streptosporangiaceae bacterium]
MTINFTARGTTAAPLRPGHRRRLLTLTAHRRLLTVAGLAGVGFSLSWIAGLAVPAPSPGFGASGTQIVAALSGHGPAVAAQFILTEGLPAAGIAVIAVALARTARRSGSAAARFALVAGLTAAVISAIQFGLGLALTATSAPGPAHLLFTSVDRLDGVKMLALAVLGAAAATMTALPRWLRWTGIALAVAITCSGLVYLLLIAPLAAAAGPALVLLLAFITGCGIMTGMTAGRRDPGTREH